MFIWMIVGITYATKCAYGLNDKGYPIETDKDPWINDLMSACRFYIGTPVCCTTSQDQGIGLDFESLDATFGSDGDGCDVYRLKILKLCSQYEKILVCLLLRSKIRRISKNNRL
jgi:hypothetical protein